MVTARIIEKKTAGRPRRSVAPPSRRRSASPRAKVSARVSRQARAVGGLGRVYLAAALILMGLAMYLVEAAHVTETSYQVQKLESEHSDLLSQQEELRYREASFQAPASLQQQVVQAGFQRVQPARYLAQPQIALNIGGDPRAGATSPPGWQGLIAGLVGRTPQSSVR